MKIKEKKGTKDIETLRQRYIDGLKYQGADYEWVETANIRKIGGIVYIQTEGDDYTFPKGNWENIKSLITLLQNPKLGSLSRSPGRAGTDEDII